MPNLVAISQVTTKINRGGRNPPPPGIECFKSPRSDRVKVYHEVIFKQETSKASEIIIQLLGNFFSVLVRSEIYRSFLNKKSKFMQIASRDVRC